MPKLTVVEPKPADEFHRLLEEYLREKRAANVSKKTLKIYRDAIEGVLFPFCAEREVKALADLTNDQLNELSVGLLDGTHSRTKRPLQAPTVHSYMRAINGFLKWAAGGEGAVRGQLPKMKRRRVLNVLSRKEIDLMEAVAKTERDKLIVRVLANTGLRLGELLRLTTADVRPEGRGWVLRIIEGKGGEDRLVPLQPPALAKRLKTFANRPQRHSESERIFLGLRKRPDTGEYEPLTESGAEQVIRQLAEEAGLLTPTRRVYPHLLRHSFATDALKRGMPSLILKQILGHTSLAMIDTTYSHLVVGDAQKALMAVLSADEDD